MSIDEKDLLKVGAEAAFKPFASLIERLFGGAVDQIGSGWEDSLKIRRRIRQLKLLTKLKARIEQAGFEPHPIPDNIWIPALEAASREDDDRLQDKWASLLANASNPNTGIHPGFVQILHNFAPLDAVVLDEVYKRLLAGFRDKRATFKLST